MTKDNEDALREAELCDEAGLPEIAAHLRRLVAENEAQDALLRKAVEALECLSEHGHRCNRCDSEVDEGGKLAAAIRQHLEGRA